VQLLLPFFILSFLSRSQNQDLKKHQQFWWQFSGASKFYKEGEYHSLLKKNEGRVSLATQQIELVLFFFSFFFESL